MSIENDPSKKKNKRMTPLPAACYQRCLDSGASPLPKRVYKMRKRRKQIWDRIPRRAQTVTLLPSSAVSHASLSSAHAEPGSKLLYLPVPSSNPADSRQTQKSTKSRFRVTCPLCPSLPRTGRGRGGRAPWVWERGGLDSDRPRPGTQPLPDPRPSWAPVAWPLQCSPQAGGLRPRRTLARSLAVHSPR